MKPAYFVQSGHTLGYTMPGSALFHILAARERLGASTADPLRTTTAFMPDELRPATLADFEAFRVRPDGHLT